MLQSNNPELQPFFDAYNRDITATLLPLWIRNVMANEPLVRRGRNMAELIGTAKNVPAILVASGPSLDRNIGLLKGLRNRAVIVACDSAYIPLLNAGCRPHIVMALDPKATNARFYAGTVSEQKHTAFVCASVVHPDVAQSWRYPPFFFNPRTDGPLETPFFEALPHLVGNFGSLAMGGNVYSVCMTLAMFGLQCSPVAFVGADYCWYEDRHHVAGATVAKFTGEVEETSDMFGQRAWWNNALRLYHTWAVLLLQGGLLRTDDNSAIGLVNCTEGGMLTAERVSNMPLEYFAERYLTADYGDIEDRLLRVNWGIAN